MDRKYLDVLILKVYDYPLRQYNYGLEFVDFKGEPLKGYFTKQYKQEGIQKINIPFKNMFYTNEDEVAVTINELIDIFKTTIIFNSLNFRDKKKVLIEKMGFFYTGHTIVDTNNVGRHLFTYVFEQKKCTI